MKINLTLILIILAMNLTVFGNDPQTTYKVFDHRGNPSDIDSIIKKLETVDVVFLGENHDDSVAHILQMEIFKRAFENYGKERTVAVSFEMFDRDVQIVMDEYLQNLITEDQFLANSRPWGNYKTDYRPLVEFAKENKLKVLAANAPRRYVNMVSRLGRNSLTKLSKQARKWLAPIPYRRGSEVYENKFRALLGGHGSENILDSQSLWDATMAFTISENYKKLKKRLVVHLNGSFHTESRLGIVQQLQKYRPRSRILVVTMQYEEDFQNFDKSKHSNTGDFVILTDTKQPRSIKK